MDEHEDNGDEVIGIGYRDVLTNLLGVIFTVVIALMVMISVKQEAAKRVATPPGNLIVHIIWPQGPTDIDMWVLAPGEPVPVGFSNKSGVVWSLLRDDLGNVADSAPFNFEDGFSRGIIPGDYSVNLVCYRCPVVPQVVDVEVSVNTGDPGKESLKVLVTTKVTLVKEGQERTAISFQLTKEGTIVDGSMNSVFVPLWQWKK